MWLATLKTSAVQQSQTLSTPRGDSTFTNPPKPMHPRTHPLFGTSLTPQPFLELLIAIIIIAIAAISGAFADTGVPFRQDLKAPSFPFKTAVFPLPQQQNTLFIAHDSDWCLEISAYGLSSYTAYGKLFYYRLVAGLMRMPQPMNANSSTIVYEGESSLVYHDSAVISSKDGSEVVGAVAWSQIADESGNDNTTLTLFNSSFKHDFNLRQHLNLSSNLTVSLLIAFEKYNTLTMVVLRSDGRKLEAFRFEIDTSISMILNVTHASILYYSDSDSARVRADKMTIQKSTVYEYTGRLFLSLFVTCKDGFWHFLSWECEKVFDSSLTSRTALSAQYYSLISHGRAYLVERDVFMLNNAIVFIEMDLDGDGKVTLDEFVQYQQRHVLYHSAMSNININIDINANSNADLLLPAGIQQGNVGIGIRNNLLQFTPASQTDAFFTKAKLVINGNDVSDWLDKLDVSNDRGDGETEYSYSDFKSVDCMPFTDFLHGTFLIGCTVRVSTTHSRSSVLFWSNDMTTQLHSYTVIYSGPYILGHSTTAAMVESGVMWAHMDAFAHHIDGLFIRNCNAGYYLNPKTQNTCDKCAAGYYQPYDGLGKCVGCAAGSYSNMLGSVSQAQCWICSLGYYSEAVGASSDSTCLPCPPGTSLATIDGDSMAASTSIDEYRFVASSRAACLPCGPGHYQDKPGSMRCKPCSTSKPSKCNLSLSASENGRSDVRGVTSVSPKYPQSDSTLPAEQAAMYSSIGILSLILVVVLVLVVVKKTHLLRDYFGRYVLAMFGERERESHVAGLTAGFLMIVLIVGASSYYITLFSVCNTVVSVYPDQLVATSPFGDKIKNSGVVHLLRDSQLAGMVQLTGIYSSQNDGKSVKVSERLESGTQTPLEGRVEGSNVFFNISLNSNVTTTTISFTDSTSYAFAFGFSAAYTNTNAASAATIVPSADRVFRAGVDNTVIDLAVTFVIEVYESQTQTQVIGSVLPGTISVTPGSQYIADDGISPNSFRSASGTMGIDVRLQTSPSYTVYLVASRYSWSGFVLQLAAAIGGLVSFGRVAFIVMAKVFRRRSKTKGDKEDEEADTVLELETPLMDGLRESRE